MNTIAFNKPFLIGDEIKYIKDAVATGKISGNGKYTQLCQQLLQTRYTFNKCLLTSSCTDALEMAAILIDIKPGDEVIIPSYTFVSSANAFVLRGAKIVFADSTDINPNINVASLEPLITPKTKAIVLVHYAGIACDMDEITNLVDKHNLYLIEDAAQAIDSYYTGKDGSKRPLGSISHLSAFSFHETKNVISGEGGMLVVNDKRFENRAEIIWEKGTNRSQFFRGEVDKYGWVDIGSSFLPSDIIAAFLYAQLENITAIQKKRKAIWQNYYEQLKPLEQQGKISLPVIPDYATNNAHMFYIVCASLSERTKLVEYLKSKKINAVFHYLSLHKSPYYTSLHDGRDLPNADRFTDSLLRLPMYFELTETQVSYITENIHAFFKA